MIVSAPVFVAVGGLQVRILYVWLTVGVKVYQTPCSPGAHSAAGSPADVASSWPVVSPERIGKGPAGMLMAPAQVSFAGGASPPVVTTWSLCRAFVPTLRSSSSSAQAMPAPSARTVIRMRQQQSFDENIPRLRPGSFMVPPLIGGLTRTTRFLS